MSKAFEWDQLRFFLAAQRAGSLRAASELLGVNHATVDRALRRLEKTLGTRLFDRTASGLSLTSAGSALVGNAEEIERQTLLISRRLTGLDAVPAGPVRVSVAPAFAQGLLAPMLPAFTEAQPEIDVIVIGTNRISDLSRHEADVSIRVARSVEDDVVGRRVVRYVTSAFASPDYLACHPGLTVGDGAGAHWVGWDVNDTGWIRSSPFPKAGQRHSLPELHLQIEAAAHGLGIAWIPAFLGDADQRLVRVPGVQPRPDRSIWILLHQDMRRNARVRAFVDFVVASLLSEKQRFTE